MAQRQAEQQAEHTPLPGWLSIESVYEGDDETTLALYGELAAYSERRGLPQQYPADPAEVALIASEAHLRACPTCSAGGPDGMCDDGRRLDARRITAIPMPAEGQRLDRPARRRKEGPCRELRRTGEALVSVHVKDEPGRGSAIAGQPRPSSPAMSAPGAVHSTPEIGEAPNRG